MNGLEIHAKSQIEFTCIGLYQGKHVECIGEAAAKLMNGLDTVAES